MEIKYNGTVEENKKSDILTMAFVNIQPFDETYELEKGFQNGTIFKSLNKPFLAGGKRR